MRILSVKMDILKQLQVSVHIRIKSGVFDNYIHTYIVNYIVLQEHCESRPESPLRSSWVSLLHNINTVTCYTSVTWIIA